MEVEKIGEYCGQRLGLRVMNKLRERAGGFEVDVHDSENLRELADVPYILIANHVKPTLPIFKQSGASPDTFVLERVVAEYTLRQLKVVARCDRGYWAEGRYRKFQQEYENPFMKGLVAGMDLVPVKRIPNEGNRDFVKKAREFIEAGHPLLIYPEGEHFDNFDESTVLKGGFELLARRFKVPVLPAYIQGCDSWQLNSQVSLIFGEAVYPADFGRKQMTLEVHQRMLGLKQLLKNEILMDQMRNRQAVAAVVAD